MNDLGLGKKRIKRRLSFFLAMSMVMVNLSAGGSFSSYGEETVGSGHVLTVNVDKVLRTLEETEGAGKTYNLENLPEEVQDELEGAVIVQKGTYEGLKYFITADLLGWMDEEKPGAGYLNGLSVVFINQSITKMATIPELRFINDETCSFEVSGEPEQIWKEIAGEEDGDGQTGAATPGNASGSINAATSMNALALVDAATPDPDPASPPVTTPDPASPPVTDPMDGNSQGDAWSIIPRSAKRIMLSARLAAFPKTVSPCDFMTNVSVTTTGGQSVENTPIDINKSVKITWEYRIPATGGVDPDINYTFSVPDVFEFNNFNEKLKGYDGKEIGKVAINGTSGSLTFNQTAKDEGYLAPNNPGSFFVTAGINKDKAGNGGLQEVSFPLNGDHDKAVSVYFPLQGIEANVELKKTSALDSSHNKIRWTIAVTPKMEHCYNPDDAKLQSLKIKDRLQKRDGYELAGSDGAGMNFQVTQADGTPVSGGVLTVVNTTEEKGFDYQFPVDTLANVSYTISYDTVFNLTSWKDSGTDALVFKNDVNRDFSYFDYEIDGGSKKAVKSSSATEMFMTDAKKVTGEQRVTGGFIKKEGEISTDGKSIEWELIINKNNYQIASASVADSIIINNQMETPADNIQFTEIKKSIWDGSGWGTAQAVPSGDISAKEENKKSGKVTINLGELHEAVRITYKTNIDEAFRLSNGTTDFRNTADLTMNGNIGITGTNTVNKVGNQFLSKSAKPYDSKDHSITWIIKVNEGSHSLTMPGGSSNITVTDTIPNGLEFDSIDITNPGTNPDNSPSHTGPGSDGIITVNYPFDFSTPSTITIRTKVVDPDLWATNHGTVSFTNTATLTAAGMAQSSCDASAIGYVSSNVLEKEGKKRTNGEYDYDPVTKQAAWKLTVNKNGMTMTNGVITDVLPEGQSFVDKGSAADSFIDTKSVIDRYTYDDTTRELKVFLKTPITGKAEIEFKTELTDFTILESNDSAEITNTASLHCDEMSGTVHDASANGKMKVTKSVVTKSGAPNGTKGLITWTVNLNKNRIPITNPELVDDLNPNLSLISNSIKLIRIAADGTETEELVDSSNVSYTGNQFVFSFNKTITDEYRLTFDTYFLKDDSYQNSIQLSGTGGKGELELWGRSTSVAAQYITGGGGMRPARNGTISIQVVDEETGQPLPGTEFSLTNGPVVQTSTTDQDGYIKFDNLWPGTYEIKETKPTVGYPASTGHTVVTLEASRPSSTSKIAKRIMKGSLAVTVLDKDSGLPLAGAKMGLYQNGVKIDSQVTGADGIVAFYGIAYGDYELVEEETPDGYVTNGVRIPVAFHIAANNESKTEQIDKEKEDPGGSGTPGTPGGNGQTGTGGNPGGNGQTGTGGTPGGDGQTGTGGTPGGDGQTGTGGNPGGDGQTGTGGTPGDSGQTGTGESNTAGGNSSSGGSASAGGPPIYHVPSSAKGPGVETQADTEHLNPESETALIPGFETSSGPVEVPGKANRGLAAREIPKTGDHRIPMEVLFLVMSISVAGILWMLWLKRKDKKTDE